jgi:hypothetical protein
MRRDDESERPDGALCAFWPESEPPLEEEVRLAFLRAFPEASLVDELERADDLHWGLVFRLPDVAGDVVVSAEPQDAADPEAIAEELEDPEERAAAAACRHVIVVQAPHDPARPTEAFRRHVRMLEAACVPGFPAVYDEPCALLRSGRALRALANAEGAPPPEALYAVHVAASEAGAWVHTHGLERFGLPELELWGVEDDEVPAAKHLLHGITGALLGGVVPDEQGLFMPGTGPAVRLLSLEDALRDFDEEIVASRREHVADDDAAAHPGPRLVVAEQERAEPPISSLGAAAEHAAYYKSRSEAQRRRRTAQERFGVFGQLFAMKRKVGWRFHAQLGFARDDGLGEEHVWFETTELRPGRLRGRCLNAPAAVSRLRLGDEDWFGLEQLTDWLVVAPDRVLDPDAAAWRLEQEH